MINTDPKNEPILAEPTVETCDAVMICLSTRRFVIVRPDEPKKDLWPINGGWERIRELKPGDQVIYRGSAATVRLLGVYR